MSARPQKRARSSSSAVPGSLAKSGAVRTKPRARIWPYATKKNYMQLWDPFPAKQMARLRYSTDISITPTTGAAGFYVFRANSIFDPDQSGVGHQPYGHDTYSTIYSKYQVKKATITVTPTSNTNCIYGVNLANAAGATGDFDLVKEKKGARFSVYNSNGPSNSVVNWYDDKLFPNQAGADADFGSNPDDQMYFNVWCTMPTSTTAGAQRDFQVTITYDVMLFDLKVLAKS